VAFDNGARLMQDAERGSDDRMFVGAQATTSPGRAT
jgi:hypothetical protein